MQTTKLDLKSTLPLTCSRSGTCCFGKVVNLNPYELYRFSREKKISQKAFRDLYCESGGTRLKFTGVSDNKGQKACSQYVENFGCSVHKGRPLACRLYPLGRQIQNNETHYIFQGKQFPCLTDCSEVLDLPKLSVEEYLKGQEADLFEKAQDVYLEVMQNIADIAFELLLDSGLAVSGDKKTLELWQEMANEEAINLCKRIDEDWLEVLMLPNVVDAVNDPIPFAEKHNAQILNKAQNEFSNFSTIEEFHRAALLMMGLALLLANGLGVDQKSIAEHWISIARKHGAI